MIHTKYKILFHVRFPTLHLLREEEIEKIKKILTNSSENIDVLFEHSDVKVDTSNAVFLFMIFLKKNVQEMLLKKF